MNGKSKQNHYHIKREHVMINMKFIGILMFVVICWEVNVLYSQVGFDFETGLTKSGYNDVRIPGDTGTLFSLTEDFKADNTVFFRGRLNYSLNSKNTFSILIAPLTIKSAGKLGKSIQFENMTFPEDTQINATYKFNSYRLTYRYELYQGKSFEFGLGLTGKIRDAKIKLKSETLESTKNNVGFVPLINFRCFLRINNQLGLLLSGDALAAPQGRAEDILAGFTYGKSDKFKIKIGYRLLEGGADNDEVYTFALINYLVFGLMVHL
jgi:hypothetical protein